MSASSSLKPVQRLAASAAIMIVASGLILLALVVPFAAPLSEAPLQAGEVAPQDILAPEALTFQSNLLTEEARQKTVAAVPPVYTPTDTTVARRQLERLHSALAYITSVRADKHASPEQKLSDLAAIEDHPLQAGTAQSIIDLTDSR